MLQNDAQSSYFVKIPKTIVNSDGNTQYLFTLIALSRSMDHYVNLSLDMLYKYSSVVKSRTTYNRYVDKWRQILISFNKENIIYTPDTIDLSNVNPKEWIYLQTNVD